MSELEKVSPLQGVTVIDSAILFAGPHCASLLGDFGADVIKIELPVGDQSRTHGPAINGTSLWWKTIGRNKKPVTLNLSTPEGQAVMLDLVKEADVWIENFRPGTLERWGLGYDKLSEVNPRLILVRVTGFGQFGPYAKRPGFGTLAESMSGFAALTGEPDGPPTLPPFGLADGVAGITAAYATMVALAAREKTGKGQVVDISLVEPLMSILGVHASNFQKLGVKQPRMGNRTNKNAPRNTYRTADGKWVAISTSSTQIAERVMALVGRPDIAAQEWFKSASGRVQHGDELDKLVADWIAQHSQADVIREFERAEAAIAPIYDVEDILADPHFQAIGTIKRVVDDEIGPLDMQNVVFRLSDTPGAIRWTGRPVGADTENILKGRLGYSDDRLKELREKGAI